MEQKGYHVSTKGCTIHLVGNWQWRADPCTAASDVKNILLSQADIQQYVARITASSGFSNSERLCELLQYTVTEALAGRGSSLKESVLGVTVLGRKPGYDSDSNSIVRVEFARLRKKLEQYYQSEGAHER